MSKEKWQAYHSATKCHICKKEGFDADGDKKKVLEHCHITGKFRGAAHSGCNTKYHLSKEIPVFFHNGSKYDFHLFIEELSNIEPDEELSIIPNTSETYTAINKNLFLGYTANGYKQTLKISFRDSFRFLTSSIEKLVNNLEQSDFKNLTKEFTSELTLKYPHASADEVQKKIKLLQRKGVFPYEAIQSFSDYESPELPTREKFASSLNGYQEISEKDYVHAQKVFKEFNCCNVGEYSDIYLKTDVLILCDIFEKFRSDCLDETLYGLDPANYYTSPGLAWDAMLKITDVEIELLQSVEQINFIKNGIRGGLSQCSVRKAEACNKFVSSEKVDDPSYLMYFDVNNLYGYAMTQKLPLKNFVWVEEEELENITKRIKSFDCNSDTSYILEVDVEYPENLHDLHNDYPFLPEKLNVGKSERLCATLYDKKNYVVHIKNLKQALRHGLKLKKVHRALKFYQSNWMAAYINLNNVQRQKATTKTKKDLCKLMNNAVFGKTIENIEKRREIRLVKSWENQAQKRGAAFFISSGRLKKVEKFSENFISCELHRVKLEFDKPTHVGFTVLEFAKHKMYEFHYEMMLREFEPKQVKLCYTDTDSFIYWLHIEDIYSEIRRLIDDPANIHLFDTSDYPSDNPYKIEQVNKKTLGAMKDECNGKLITQFIGLRSKCYSFTCYNEGNQNKAKGTKKYVVAKLKMSEYEASVADRNLKIIKNQSTMRSRMHKVYTENLNKVALNSNDEKRYILEDNYSTLALGHYLIRVDK